MLMLLVISEKMLKILKKTWPEKILKILNCNQFYKKPLNFGNKLKTAEKKQIRK